MQMAKELYLYSPIYDFVAESLIAQMEDNSDSDITIRINSPGGSVLSGYGIIAKMRERKDVKTSIKVDGAAMSMACYALAYATGEVECLDVSKFMLHPADMYVSDEATQSFLDGMNKDLRAVLEAKIDSDKLKKFTGYSIADMFENKDCPDLFFNAKQAKALGLVTKINKLNTDEAKAINEKMFAVAAIEEPKDTQIQKPNKMEIKSLADLKTTFPNIYAEAVKEGADAEFTRVNSFNVFRGVDAKAVDAAIKERKPFTTDFQSEMLLKAANPKALKAIEEEAVPAVVTEEAGKPETPEAKAKAEALAKFEESIDKAYADRSVKPVKK